MKVISRERTIFCDVDGTLIDHINEFSDKSACIETIEIPDPVSGGFIIVGINKPMVRLVREEYARGACIFVWSRGGYQWASSVVKALGLEKCVAYVLSKPLTYFDDLDVSDWLKDRVFIDSKTVYKTQRK